MFPLEYMAFVYIPLNIIFIRKVSINTISQMSQSDAHKQCKRKSRSCRKSVGIKIIQNSFLVSATLTIKIIYGLSLEGWRRNAGRCLSGGHRKTIIEYLCPRLPNS